MSKTLTILGSTGTIGCNTLKVIREYKENFEIVALTAGNNAKLLAKQAIEFHPKLVVISNEAHYAELKVTITASGGSVLNFSLAQMAIVTPEQAIKHPNWNMGAKISVDSATMMNKGLELIEAFYLFPLQHTQLDILVHPQSIIHALVTMVDGSVLAQLSSPDMCTPIAYALGYPQRISAPVARLNLAKIRSLTFEKPDEVRFPAIKIARDAMLAGGNAPTILNAANEIAVQQFLDGKIGFLDIAKIVEKTLEKISNTKLETIEEVLVCDAKAREISKTEFHHP